MLCEIGWGCSCSASSDPAGAKFSISSVHVDLRSALTGISLICISLISTNSILFLFDDEIMLIGTSATRADGHVTRSLLIASETERGGLFQWVTKY